MSAQPPSLEWITLANGLRVSLRHAPRLKRCAAVLRVAAGSHDVAVTWPGLAHFLEHLLFLGTERFPAGQHLMAYVQRHGGQVNARTSERTTDFFFELTPQSFAGGLERLCDMLAHPRLSLADQLREREILHAEFIAWSREAAAKRQFTLFQQLSPPHPLRAFHAGNRFSLPVPNPAFQQALQAFYGTFYQAGQMSLSLAGPQSLAELRQLAETFATNFATGPAVTQHTPPTLMDPHAREAQLQDGTDLNLLFAFENLPEHAEVALDFLCTWLNSTQAGGLLATLRERQRADHLSATVLYQFAGQALLHLELKGCAQGAGQAEAVCALLRDWLMFLRGHGGEQSLRDEYRLLKARQWQVAGALQLAQWDAAGQPTEWTESTSVALESVLQQMDVGPHSLSVETWALPSPNPFLRAVTAAAQPGLIRGQTSAHRGLRTFAQDRSRNRREPSAMTFSQTLPDDNGEGAIILRWTLASVLSPDLSARLEKRLHRLIEDARQAGVECSLMSQGNEWLLKMIGLHEPMPAILEQALDQLIHTDSELEAEAAHPAPLMPIRQLLKALPDAYLNQAPASSANLKNLWPDTQWEGLALGLPAATQAAVTQVLKRAPGRPEAPTPALKPTGEKRWHSHPCESSEQALLLLCPAPSASLEDEAAWRLLAHLSQGPFYQRLRVEQQLGYAVFSGLRQINGRTGLLFGVQSPHATREGILTHVLSFIGQLPDLIARLDDSEWTSQREALASQFDAQALPLAQAVELLWQGQQTPHSSDYLQCLQQAILGLTRPVLQVSAQQLEQAAGGWLCLATGPGPDASWQETT